MLFSLTSLNKKYFSPSSSHSFASLTRFHEEGEKNFLFREVRENTPFLYDSAVASALNGKAHAKQLTI